MSENALLTLIVVAVLVVLVVVVLRQPSAAGPGQAPSVKTILLGVAVLFFLLTGLGIFPGLAWGLACLAAAFLL